MAFDFRGLWLLDVNVRHLMQLIGEIPLSVKQGYSCTVSVHVMITP